MNKRFLVSLIILSLVFIIACGQKQDKPETMQESGVKAKQMSELQIVNPWVRLAPKGMNSGMFAAIINNTAEDDSLLSVESDAAELVEVHETYKMDNDMMGMRQVPYLAIPVGDTLNLKPGGYHVMLISLTRDLNKGDTVKAVFNFAKHKPIEVTGVAKELEMKSHEMKMK